MDQDFWHRRWEKNEIGFHMTDPHHFLQKFFPLLQTQLRDRIFIPLCGKSPDMVWLREEGLNVVGIELSRTAVEAFFVENDLVVSWSTRGEIPCSCADGYEIYCGDFFTLPAAELAGISAFYDRGALVALPPEMRACYTGHLSALLPSDSRILLVGYRYNQAETDGPPFSVSQEELETLFVDNFQMEILAEEEALWSHQGLAARGVTQLTEYAVLLTRK